MSDEQAVAVSTRDTKVECCVCHRLVKNEKSVYGVSPYSPLNTPDHFCLRCGEVYNVQDWAPIDNVKG